MNDAAEDEYVRQRSPEPEPGPSAMHVEDDAKQSAEATTERAEKPVRPTETLVISQDDARFLIGAQGKTKKKLMKVSGASIEISAIEGDAEGKQRLEIAAEDEAKLKFARECCEWVLQQRVGKIVVDTSVERDYLSAIDVDPECVAYVTGAQGSGLRRIEADYGTLMFFATRSTHPEDEGEKLIIVGSRKGRRGSELSVMAACERKKPGTHVNEETKLRNRFEQPGDGLGDGWGFDVFPFANQDELSFAIGRGGSTRKRIAAASGAAFEYVGMLGVMAGDRDERARCWDYIRWVMKSAKGNTPADVEYKDRQDVSVFPVKSGKGGVNRLIGRDGNMLRDIENMSGTVCMNIPDPENEEGELMLILSHDKRNRDRALDAMQQVLVHGRFGPGQSGRRDDRRGNDRPRGGINARLGGKERCYDFTQGRCRYGDSCRFAHIVPDYSNDYGGNNGRGGPSRGANDRPSHPMDGPYGRPQGGNWGAGSRRGR